MKYTDYLFKYAKKVFSSKELNDWEKAVADAGTYGDVPPPSYTVVDAYCRHDVIDALIPSFDYGKTVKEIEDEGCTCTSIVFKNGTSSECAWPINKLKSKLNSHIRKLERMEVAQLQKEADEKALVIREAIEKRLADVKQQMKDNNLEINFENL